MAYDRLMKKYAVSLVYCFQSYERCRKWKSSIQNCLADLLEAYNKTIELETIFSANNFKEWYSDSPVDSEYVQIISFLQQVVDISNHAE